MNVFRIVALVALICGLSLTALAAEDWPTYLHDMGRSGVTPAQLPAALREQWVYQAPAAPKPAWPRPQYSTGELPKLLFDPAFFTVAVGDTIYFGSSVDHAVHALDATTGAVRWTFITDGPVRFAPTVANDRVYVGSDDGCVYCLEATTGQLRWQYRGWPEERRVLGSGRMMSVWPIRTGVIVDQGVAYFGVGIGRNFGTALVALHAEDGMPVWRNDAPHTRFTAAFAPQGYLAAGATTLLAPSGRMAPSLFLRKDGSAGAQLAPKASGKGLAGGVDVHLIDGLFYLGTQNTLYGVDPETGEGRQVWSSARRFVATPTHYVLLDGVPPAAGGNKKPQTITVLDRATLAEHEKRDAVALKAATRWRVARPGLVSLIVAGTDVIAGGENMVMAWDLATGKERWTIPVTGNAFGITVAHGRLLVSTDAGAIHCFAAGAPARATAAPRPPFPMDARTPLLAQTAEAIVRDTEVTTGYALLLGAEAAPLAVELSKRTELSLYCVDADAARVARARQALLAAGLYGTRIVVDQATEGKIPHPPYFANLVLVLGDAGKGYEAQELLRAVKPYGGILLAGAPDGAKPALPDTAAWQQAGSLNVNYALAGKGAWVKLTRGALPGAGNWTHQYGNPGGTGSSGDTLAKLPLDPLWYGEPGAGEMADRHWEAQAPLTINGRVFFQGVEYLGTYKNQRNFIKCFDLYNGTEYWEREIPGAYRIFITHTCGNMACTADSVFVAAGSKCYRLSTHTGEVTATYEAPPAEDGTPRAWGYVAVADGMLLGTAAVIEGHRDFDGSPVLPLHVDTLFAIDLRTGQQRWLHRGTQIRHNTIVVCDGRVLFGSVPDAQAAKPAGPDLERAKRLGLVQENVEDERFLCQFTALELVTGKAVWNREIELTSAVHWRVIQAVARDGILVIGGTYSSYGASRSKGAGRPAMALAVADGAHLWVRAVSNVSRLLIVGDLLLAEPFLYDLRTGEQKMGMQGTRQVPVKVGDRAGACGPIAASANMLFFRHYPFTAWDDLTVQKRPDTFGTRTFNYATRPGCWYDMYAASGVVLELEASSGCRCAFTPVQATFVHAPREVR